MLRLARIALPIVAVLVFVFMVGATLAVADETLGYDFRAYHGAAVRVLAGGPLYDLSFEAAGGFGLFYYPPFFAPLVLPFGLLPEMVAIWVWTVALLAAFLAGVAVLPVSRTIRWLILLLAGLGWLVAYAVKLGQVGPILFLLFAIGWRWLNDPGRVGWSAGLGTAVKLQPGIILLWAVLTRRWRAVGVGAAVLAGLALIATFVSGPEAWSDFIGLVRQVADPITTAKNATPGAIAYQMGLPADVAYLIQGATAVVFLGAVLAAVRWATEDGSYLVAVVASQLLSPVLWDHYALLLLLPVAYLCSKGWWWAVAIPIATSLPLLGLGPPLIYPGAFGIGLGATLWVGIREKARAGLA